MKRLILLVAGTLAVGAAAGAVWLWWAEPAQWTVTDRGAVMGEVAGAAEFAVVFRFVVVGLVASALLGTVATVLWRPLGWRLVPFVAAVSGAAALIAWQVGVLFGPGDPSKVSAKVGSTFPDQLAVPSVAPFLAWPFAAIAAVWVVTWLSERDLSQHG